MGGEPEHADGREQEAVSELGGDHPADEVDEFDLRGGEPAVRDAGHRVAAGHRVPGVQQPGLGDHRADLLHQVLPRLPKALHRVRQNPYLLLHQDQSQVN